MASSYTAVQAGPPGSEELLPGRESDCEAGAKPAACAAGLPARRRRAAAWGVLGAALFGAAVVAARKVAQRDPGDRIVATHGMNDNLLMVEISFDCNTGYENWVRGWSDTKKKWCCSHAGQGCDGSGGNVSPGGPGGKPFDCDAGLNNWEAGWSIPKKIWCCSNEDKGCPEPTHVSVTFVIANVNFQLLKQTRVIVESFGRAVIDVIVKQVGNGVQPQNVMLKYWAGSALYIQGVDSANTGVVVRARIAVPAEKLVSSVRDALSAATFPKVIDLAVEKVGGIRTVSAGAISVHDLSVEMPIVSACTCEGGEAEVAPKCPKYGGQLCRRCNRGYHLTTGYFCMRNSCTCSSGVAAEGELCDRHEGEKCAFCFPGYHIDSATGGCAPNRCVCANGQAASGPACGMDQGEICGSCNPGYHVDFKTKMCESNACVCRYGTAAQDEACIRDHEQICSSCERGYHLADDEVCEPNTCTCRDGTAALEALCDTDRGEICAFCKPGLHLHRDGTCGQKVCLCPNGTAATGPHCDTHHATLCTECGAGFVLTSGQCLSEGCGCENGTPRSGSACTSPGQSICERCDHGYHLAGDRCEPNHCLCTNGDPAMGKQCAVDGGLSCSACKPGYRHSLGIVQDSDGTPKVTMSCVENECVCLDGDREVGERATARSEPKCNAPQSNACTTCIAGYHLSPTYQCLPNNCTCNGGTPVTYHQCAKDGTENCTSCAGGFFLASKPLASADVELGFKPPSLGDFAGGARVCVPNGITTSKPFDCNAALGNWERAWSDVKKHWCCKNENLGCTPTATGVELCENGGFNSQQCDMVGCCKFDGQKCLSDVGTGVCFPEFNIRNWEGYCLTVVDDAVQVDSCNAAETAQEWRPSAKGQIESPQGLCLQVDRNQPGAAVRVAPCSAADALDPAQALAYDREAQLLKTPQNLCLSTHYGRDLGFSVKLNFCLATDVNQRWSVPEVR